VSRQQKIREWLATQDGPRTSRQIAEGIGEPIERTQWSVSQMAEDGMLAKEATTGRAYLFRLVRDARPNVRAPNWRANKTAKARELRALRRGFPSAEAFHAWRAEQDAKKRAERVAAEQAEKAQRARAVAAERERLRRERAALAAKRRDEMAERMRVCRFRVSNRPNPIMPPPVIGQSVEEWLANGGKVQRLDPGATSQPFKHIGRAA
jgi:hypothetical protein